MTYGTSHFVSKPAAVRYYGCQMLSSHSDAQTYVAEALRDGSIHIGKPTLQPGETLSVIDGGTRYAITEAK